jgi:hypothetical protein
MSEDTSAEQPQQQEEKWYETSFFQNVILPLLILGIPIGVAFLLKYLGVISG